MNKLDLIATFKNETRLTTSEATAVVDLFFNEMTAPHSQRVTGSKSVDCVPSMSRNTRRIPGGILKLVNQPK